MRSIKLLLIIILAATFTACHTSRKGNSRSYTIMLYKDLRKELGDAEVKRRGDTVRIIYPELAMFDFGKSVIKPEALPAFGRFSAVLKNYDRIYFYINGYTDNVGTDDVNLSLSRDRAMSAKTLLEGNGINGGRMMTNGMGSSNPIMSNTTPDGRQANRRVEFVLYENKSLRK